jgi:hypothetical protein
MSSASRKIIHIFWNLEVCYHSHNSPASHKSNPSSIPQGIVDLYSTLPWVTWEAVTGVEGIPCCGVATTPAG